MASEQPPLDQAPLSAHAKQSYKGVKGWLLWFCISLSILTPGYRLLRLQAELVSVNRIHVADLRLFALTKLIVSLVFVVIGVVIGVRLWTVTPNAVRHVRLYLFCWLVWGVTRLVFPTMWALAGHKSTHYFQVSFQQFIGMCAYSVIWLAYFATSKRVEATYNV